MKKAWLIILLPIVCYPAVAWLIGGAIQAHNATAHASVAKLSPYLSVVGDHFRRGWFSSEEDATYEFALGALPLAAAVAPGGQPGDFRVTVHSVIHHGPICAMDCFGLARTETHLVFSEAVRAALARAFGAAEPLSITSRSDFRGGTSMTITSPRVDRQRISNGEEFSSGGLTLALSTDADADHWSAHGAVPLPFSGTAAVLTEPTLL